MQNKQFLNCSEHASKFQDRAMGDLVAIINSEESDGQLKLVDNHETLSTVAPSCLII